MSKEAERVFLTTMIENRKADFPFKFSIPNKLFDIPKNATYGEFHIVSGPKSVIKAGHGKGKARVEYLGFVQMNVWIPKDKGTIDGTKAEGIFKKIYQMRVGRDSACAVYEFSTIQSITAQTKAGYEVFAFRVPFTRTIVEDVQVSI